MAHRILQVVFVSSLLLIRAARVCSLLPPPTPVCSFYLGDVSSAAVFSRSSVSVSSYALDSVRTVTASLYYDAASGLVVNATKTVYASPSLSADEWTLSFWANGTASTPPLCGLSPLNMSLPDAPAGAGGATDVYRFLGSSGAPTDFSAVNETLWGAGTLLPGVRLWGPVSTRNESVPSASACASACAALGPAACAGSVWTANVSYTGCYLLPTVAYTTEETTFISYLAPGGSGGSASTWAPVGGRSSNGVLPFFLAAVRAAPLPALAVSIGWSGNWEASVSRDDVDGSTHVAVTHGTPGFCAPIRPNEPPLRSMRILLVYFNASGPDGYIAGVNAHRSLLVRFKLPRAPTSPYTFEAAAATAVAPPLPLLGALVSSWSWIGWPEYPSLTLASQLQHVAYVRESACVEAYWLDAGWFPGGFPSGVGNWRLPLSDSVYAPEFPGGSLAPLAAAAHASPGAVQNIVWFEPERVASGTYMFENESSLLVPEAGGGGGDRLLDLGNPDAVAYMHAYLSAAVQAYSLDVLRLDFNIDPAPLWAAADALAGDGTGLTELRYVAGLYALWDGLLAAAPPGLLIDNCASGGRRIDLETLSRSVPLWRTDDAGTSSSQQLNSMGLSVFAPISSGAVMAWDPYSWRSAGIVGKTISWGVAGWEAISSDPSALASLRMAVAETQRLRTCAIFGDYFPLTPILADEGTWAAYQFHCDPARTAECSTPGNDGAFGFVMAMRRSAGPPSLSLAGLRHINMVGNYSASWAYDYATNHTATGTGADLLLSAVVALQPLSSVLIEYVAT